MRIINFGSLNIDHVYRVDRFVQPGETIPSLAYSRFCGGKGLNQSIALARAGAEVRHYGKIGTDGADLVEMLNRSGVDTSSVSVEDGPTGHAIIQVSGDGENSIIIEGGANRLMDDIDIETVFSELEEGDWLLLQNEVSAIDTLFGRALDSPCRLAFNPAPMTEAVNDLPLHRVDLLIVNESEGRALTGRSGAPDIVSALTQLCPKGRIVLTLGARGAICADGNRRIEQPGFPVDAVDTTAAGDTFVGYFLAASSSGKTADAALEQACKAASICVTRPGAAASIPYLHEIEAG
jgi:ribokinase